MNEVPRQDMKSILHLPWHFLLIKETKDFLAKILNTVWPSADFGYDFILPYMVLDTMFFKRNTELYQNRPEYQFTTMDCHDGIPVMPDLEGLINEDDAAYIASRAIQFFVPGIPQVYYAGMLAGENDILAADRTGEDRDLITA